MHYPQVTGENQEVTTRSTRHTQWVDFSCFKRMMPSVSNLPVTSTRWRRSRTHRENKTERAPPDILNPRSTFLNLLPRYVHLYNPATVLFYNIAHRSDLERLFLPLLKPSRLMPGRYGNTLSIGLHNQVQEWIKVTSDLYFSFGLLSNWRVYLCSWMRLCVPVHRTWPVRVSISPPLTPEALLRFLLGPLDLAAWG